MKFYMAGRYSRRASILGYACDLIRAGHTCTATWLHGEHEALDQCGTREDHIAWAAQDRADIKESDVFIVFTGENRRGGTHTELGIAIESGKRILIVGPRPENIFYAAYERIEEWYVADILAWMEGDTP